MELKKERYIFSKVVEDLEKKMVIVGGPRQVGKTTLSFRLLGIKKGENHPAYLNWDIKDHRTAIMKEEIPANQPLLVFDEIHKYINWRRMVKGFYDLYYPDKKCFITGSARMDFYSKGGDSLMGRYHYYRLHPYSLNEMSPDPNKEDLDKLLRWSGFPEPLYAEKEQIWRRWQKERISRIIENEIRDLNLVKEINLMELLYSALPEKVGSPLSLQSLREDLQVSHESIKRWLQIFENMYLCFRISPYGAPKIRAVKKEQKLYFWDWTEVKAPGSRFENLVACQLLKYCHFLEDTEGFKMDLRFIRDVDKREIDFLVLKDGKPEFAVECKSGEKEPSSSLAYFRERTDIPKFYQVHTGTKDYGDALVKVRVLPFVQFVKETGMP